MSTPESMVCMHNRDSIGKKKQNVRKEPEREFFEMTVLAFQLKHPMSLTVLTVDRDKLFMECRKVHKSFQDWPDWINSTLTRVVLNEKYNKAKNA